MGTLRNVVTKNSRSLGPHLTEVTGRDLLTFKTQDQLLSPAKFLSLPSAREIQLICLLISFNSLKVEPFLEEFCRVFSKACFLPTAFINTAEQQKQIVCLNTQWLRLRMNAVSSWKCVPEDG